MPGLFETVPSPQAADLISSPPLPSHSRALTAASDDTWPAASPSQTAPSRMGSKGEVGGGGRGSQELWDPGTGIHGQAGTASKPCSWQQRAAAAPILVARVGLHVPLGLPQPPCSQVAWAFLLSGAARPPATRCLGKRRGRVREGRGASQLPSGAPLLSSSSGGLKLSSTPPRHSVLVQVWAAWPTRVTAGRTCGLKAWRKAGAKE